MFRLKPIFVQEFVEHPDYDVARIENDVALVKLPSNSVPAYTSESDVTVDSKTFQNPPKFSSCIG